MAKTKQRKGRGQDREPKEFLEEVLKIDRVTRVVKGGRRLRFRASVVVGDKKGRVGFGVGKATEVVTAIQKAVARAKVNLIHVPITKGDTIPHAVRVKYKAARLIIMPASQGTGTIAGGSLRKVLALAGVKNVLSKNIGTRNTLVTAQTAIKGLKMLRPVPEGKAKVFKAEKKARPEKGNSRNQSRPSSGKNNQSKQKPDAQPKDTKEAPAVEKEVKKTEDNA